MDRRFLEYYNRELLHLLDRGGEFARANPKIARRLGMNEHGPERPADPYVERLMEASAFLSARVQVKLDAEFPRFTQSLLQTIYPHYLAPTPSMAVMRLEPDFTQGSLAEGFVVKRETVLRSTEFLGESSQTKCVYRTAHDVTLWPLEVAEAQYYTRDVGTLGVDVPKGTRAAIRIRLKALGGLLIRELPLDRITFFLSGGDEIPMRLYEQFFAHATQVVAHPGTAPVPWIQKLKSPAVGRVGFADHEALIPHGPRSFQGYRLLHEYFSFPERYLFIELGNLGPAVERCESEFLDIIVLLDQEDIELERVVDRSSFKLFCTPAINLFKKRADRIDISDRFNEFHVVPDKACPRDYEVYEIQSVTGFGSRSDNEQQFQSFYAATDFDAHEGGAYFATHRVARMPSSKERRARRGSSYPGSEVYLSLVDSTAAPYRSDLRQLAVSTLCTNRDLPLTPLGRDRPHFQLDQSAPVIGAWCEKGPTAPRPSPAEGDVAWRLVSHLKLNYLSITDVDELEGAAALRDLLKLYCDLDDLQRRKQVEGVTAVDSKPIVRRAPTAGPIAFARGLEINVHLDEAAFHGTGVFLLGAVLERFFAKYVSINSFTETVVSTARRGEIMRWPARIGQRHML